MPTQRCEKHDHSFTTSSFCGGGWCPRCRQESCWLPGTLRAMLLADALVDLFPPKKQKNADLWDNHLMTIWASVHGCCAMDNDDRRLIDDIVSSRFYDGEMYYDLFCDICGFTFEDHLHPCDPGDRTSEFVEDGI